MLNSTDTILSTKTITCVGDRGWVDDNEDVMCKENMIKVEYQSTGNGQSTFKYFKIGSKFCCTHHLNECGGLPGLSGDPQYGTSKRCKINGVEICSEKSNKTNCIANK
jgi:hypothetical protein